MVTIGFGKPIPDVLRDEKAVDIRIRHNYKVSSFAKMIAKIAWSMAAAQGSINKIDLNNSILPSLMSDGNTIGIWVGSIGSPIESVPNTLHCIDVVEDGHNGLLVSKVKLFSRSQTPTYQVVLGRLL